MAGIGAVTFLLWYFLLTPEGELAHLEPLRVPQEYEQRAFRHLESLNRIVLELGQRASERGSSGR